MRIRNVFKLAVLMAVMLGMTGCVFFWDNDISVVKFIVGGEEFTEELLELQAGHKVNIKIEVFTYFGQKVNNCIVKWELEHGTDIIGTLNKQDGYEVTFTAADAIEKSISGSIAVTVESPVIGTIIKETLQIKVEPAEQ